MRYLNQFAWRHAISATVAVLIAVYVEREYSFSEESWIVLSAFLVSQTTRGTPLKQALYFFALIASGLLVAAMLAYAIPSVFLYQLSTCTMFAAGGLAVFYHRPLPQTNYFTILLLPLTVLLAIALPTPNHEVLTARLADVLLGTIIGMFCIVSIFPTRPYKDLVHGVSALLNVLKDYEHSVSDYFLGNENHVKQKHVSIERSLQMMNGSYPEWIFEAGFNPRLRSGYRFFLITIERVSELCFSIDYLIGAGVKKHLSASAARCVASVANTNADLIASLNDKLAGSTLAEEQGDDDLMSDIESLEKEVQKEMPEGLEAISFHQDYAQVAALVRDLKDIRQLLLQLVVAVPVPVK